MLSSSRAVSQLFSGVIVEEEPEQAKCFYHCSTHLFVCQHLRSSTDLEATKVIQKFS